MASPISAANAYANSARVLDTGGSSNAFGSLGRVRDVLGNGTGADKGGPSFSAVLKDAIGDHAAEIPGARDENALQPDTGAPAALE